MTPIIFTAIIVGLLVRLDTQRGLSRVQRDIDELRREVVELEHKLKDEGE